MLISTADFIPNTEIIEMKGSVFSEQVVSVNAAKDIMNNIKGIFGGKHEAYSSEYKKVRMSALKDLEEQAEKMNGNAIINVKIQYNQFINSDIIFIIAAASGVVLKVKNTNE